MCKPIGKRTGKCQKSFKRIEARGTNGGYGDHMPRVATHHFKIDPQAVMKVTESGRKDQLLDAGLLVYLESLQALLGAAHFE